MPALDRVASNAGCALTLAWRLDVFVARSDFSATTDGIGAHVLLRRG